jgi:DNA-binding transcriptional ArsR family regulator
MTHTSEKQTPYHLCFDTLANQLRIDIVKTLEKTPASVEDISKALTVEQSRVSHSLKALKACSYVDVKADGRKRMYSLKPGIIEDFKTKENKGVFTFFNEHFEKQCNFECKKQ